VFSASNGSLLIFASMFRFSRVRILSHMIAQLAKRGVVWRDLEGMRASRYVNNGKNKRKENIAVYYRVNAINIAVAISCSFH